MRDEVEKRLTKRLAEAGFDRQDKTVEAVITIVLEVCAEIFKEELQGIDDLLEGAGRQSAPLSRP